MIHYVVNGDLLKSDRQTLINTVNCDGAMGKGLALQFKQRYPAMFARYAAQCKQGAWKPGMICPYKLPDGRQVLNVATKDHWRNPSELVWIERIVASIVGNHERLGIKSLAMPKLGCGNGCLEWSVVGPLMADALRNLPFDTYIYVGSNDVQY
jgi:O-acetyl-ADP-ribose deacetylase (regulator of RNase III)